MDTQNIAMDKNTNAKNAGKILYQINRYASGVNLAGQNDRIEILPIQMILHVSDL